MKIVILEDNLIEFSKIKTALNEWNDDYDIELDIMHFSSGEDFFSNESNYDPNTDLFLLDVEMKKLNGIEVAKKLRLQEYKGEIIFLTAFKDFVFEGYNVHAFNYLVKPIDKNIFFKCLTEIENKRHANCYTYRNKQKHVISIPYPEIISFSVNKHSVDITTPDKTFDQYINLNTILKILPRQFVQVHRSCIINLAHIYKVSQNIAFLSNGCKVEIGRTYQKDFRKQFLQYTTRFNRNEDFN